MGLAVIIILAFLLVKYFLLNIFYKRTNHYKNSMVAYRYFMDKVPGHIGFANLGSTYAQYAFNSYEDIGLEGAYNFALPCESAEADLVKLKMFSSHLGKGCKVAITLAPCNTLYHWGQLDEGIKHYSFMPKSLKKDWSLNNFIRYHFPIFPLRIRKATKILSDTEYIKDIVDAYPKTVYSQAEIEKRSKTTAEGWMKMFGLNDLKSPVFDERNIQAIRENKGFVMSMIDHCQANGFVPIVVVPPFSKALNEYFSQEFIDSTLGVIFAEARKRGVGVYDFRTSEDFQNNSELYVDGFFCLNRAGSVKFLKQLFEAINKDGTLQD